MLTGYAHSPVLLTIAITFSAVGILSAIPVFWALPTALLTGSAAAAGIGLVAAIGNLGGFFGPSLTGALEDSTGDFVAPFNVLAVMLAVGAVLALLAREQPVAAPRPAVAGAGD